MIGLVLAVGALGGVVFYLEREKLALEDDLKGMAVVIFYCQYL